MPHVLLYVDIQASEFNSVILCMNILFVVGCFRRVSNNYIVAGKAICTSVIKQRIVLVWSSSIHLKGHFFIHACMCILGLHTDSKVEPPFTAQKILCSMKILWVLIFVNFAD